MVKDNRKSSEKLTKDIQRLLQIVQYTHHVICYGWSTRVSDGGAPLRISVTMDVISQAIFLLVFLSHIHFAYPLEDCSKDGSCEGEQEKHGKEKYLPKGWP